MNDAEFVKRNTKAYHRRAKFVRYSHSSTFVDPTANLGQGFHYVNLYDEQIDSNVITSSRGLILVHNTYLPSFAYNLFLCWMLHTSAQMSQHSPQPPDLSPELSLLLRHNFKKFFAEQLFALRNTIFARALLLETLLFEQVCMVPVFAAKEENPELARQAKSGAHLMSSLVSFHELTHFFASYNPQEWEGVRQSAGGDLAGLYERISQAYPPAFVEEFKCDAAAVVSCLRLYEEEMGKEFCLQAIVFAFAAFATLSSLTKSARQTWLNQEENVEAVDFTSLEKQHRGYDYAVGIDEDFAERFRLMQTFCENLAEEANLRLYDSPEGLWLSPNILDQFFPHVHQILDTSDGNARAMSMLVAEALHDHPQGIEYLYLRSKTFDFPSGS